MTSGEDLDVLYVHTVASENNHHKTSFLIRLELNLAPDEYVPSAAIWLGLKKNQRFCKDIHVMLGVFLTSSSNTHCRAVVDSPIDMMELGCNSIEKPKDVRYNSSEKRR